MKRFYLLLLIGSLLIGSCSKTSRSSLQMIEVNGKSIPLLKFKDIKDTISLSLSQLFDNVSFVKLETNNDNKLSMGKWSPGKKYFIVLSFKSGIFQFNSDGKFIRKLANIGNGPHEIFNPAWAISRDESQIFIYDSHKPKDILCFDLNSGIFLKNIPLAFEGRLKNIYLINDSVLALAPVILSGTPAGRYYVYWQDISGKFIRGIPSVESKDNSTNDQDLLYPVGNYFHYRSWHSDTIFLIKNYQMEPCFIFDPQNNIINPKSDIGRTDCLICTETTDFMIVGTYTATTQEKVGANAYTTSGVWIFYYIDKIKNKAFVISTFYNDFLGEPQSPSLFRNQTGDLKYISIEAISLMKKINAIKLNSGIKIINRAEFLNLETGLGENDNPILLVGRFKNN